ncbi:MAG: hypothetical protein ACRDO0_12385 [Nocardioidaceae bacterium]
MITQRTHGQRSQVQASCSGDVECTLCDGIGGGNIVGGNVSVTDSLTNAPAVLQVGDNPVGGNMQFDAQQRRQGQRTVRALTRHTQARA